MLIKQWMSEQVITVDADESMNNAVFILEENRISLLPVVDNGQLVGIISDRDLKRASPPLETVYSMEEFVSFISEIKIRDLMTSHPLTLSPENTVQEAALLLIEKRISGLPIVSPPNKVVGIITRTDLLEALVLPNGRYGSRQNRRRD